MTDAIEDDLLEVEPLTDEEILACQPLNTDSANADIFEKRYATSTRWVTQWDRWIAWDTNRWILEGAEHKALAWALYSARTSYTEVLGRVEFLKRGLKAMLIRDGAKSDESEKTEAHIKHLEKVAGWYLGSQNTARGNSCLKAAATRLLTPLSRLDADPFLFNVANGTIDLRTGDLREHDRDDMITQLSPIEWDDHATCPTWDRFIRETMQGDLEMALYLQRVVGYCMTASIEEHALFFLFGGGSNGKSTFTRTVSEMMGEYACAAPRNLLFEQKWQGHETALARLYGRRFVTCAEIGENHAFDEAKVKDLTGGDAIAVRRMQEDFWDLQPTHKLLIAGNHKPRVKGVDKGFWRRFRLVPWNFSPSEPDRALPEKLRAELPGILRWAVNGALEWGRLGLAEPQSVIDATAAYRAESDVVGAFLETCTKGDGLKVPAGDIRAAYEAWCHDLGHIPLGGRMFGERLKGAGFKQDRWYAGESRVRGWVGIHVQRPQNWRSKTDPEE